MQVREIMTKDVSSCSPGTNAAAAGEKMWNKGCGSLPVIERSGRAIGMITDRDLFIALATQNRRASDLRVGEVMRREPSVCRPGVDVRQAVNIMARQRVHRLPVVDEAGGLQGILSMDDVILRTDVAFNDAVWALEAIVGHGPGNARVNPTAL